MAHPTTRPSLLILTPFFLLLFYPIPSLPFFKLPCGYTFGLFWQEGSVDPCFAEGLFWNRASGSGRLAGKLEFYLGSFSFFVFLVSFC